jgi:hypothetical protein
MRQLNRRQIRKHHAPKLQNNMMLKDEAQKILNLKRATLQKNQASSDQPAKLAV